MAPSTQSSSPLRSRRVLTAVIIAAAVALFLVLSILYARTKAPLLDEALQGSAAYSLVAHSHFALPQLEESGISLVRRLPRIQQYCYIYGPVYLTAAAAWLKAFGYGMLQIRSFSIAWGLIAMAAWFVIIRSLTRDRFAAALGVLLLAVNYQFIVSAASGRFDMMCASLGSVALATYLALREHHLRRAIFLSSLAVAGAFFTHPMGLIWTLALLWTIAALDWRRIRLPHAGWFAAPWLMYGAAVMAWIWPHRALASSQFSTNTSARWAALSHPLYALLSDVTHRYIFFYLPTGNAVARSKVLIVLIHAAFIAAFFCGALLVRRIRNSDAFRVLGPCLIIVYCSIALLDNLTFPYYMIHMFLFASATVAVVAAACRATRMRYFAATGIAALILLQIGGIALKVRENSYAREFLPTVRYIRAHTAPGQYVEGDMALNFGLGYADPDFHMDTRMGLLTGIRPAMIVTDEFSDIEEFRNQEPDVYRFISHRLGVEYRQVAQFGDYRIYEPR